MGTVIDGGAELTGSQGAEPALSRSSHSQKELEQSCHDRWSPLPSTPRSHVFFSFSVTTSSNLSHFCCFPRDLGCVCGNHKNRNPIRILLWAVGKWNHGRLSSLAILGVAPELQETLNGLESSGRRWNQLSHKAGLTCSRVGDLPVRVPARNWDRKVDLEQRTEGKAADKSTFLPPFVRGSPGLRLASSLCHRAVSQGCPAGQIC